MTTRMRLMVASDTEREEVFVELYYGEEQWGEITEDPTSRKLCLEIFPPSSKANYLFDLADTLDILVEAKRRMERAM